MERQKAAAEANLTTATQQLDARKAEAREKYGTDDLEQLRKLLEKMKQENEQKRAAYQQHLEQIDASLAEVEKEFAGGKGG